MKVLLTGFVIAILITGCKDEPSDPETHTLSVVAANCTFVVHYNGDQTSSIGVIEGVTGCVTFDISPTAPPIMFAFKWDDGDWIRYTWNDLTAHTRNEIRDFSHTQHCP